MLVHVVVAPSLGVLVADLAVRVAEVLAARVFDEAEVRRVEGGRAARVEAPQTRVDVRADAGRVRLEGHVRAFEAIADAVRAAWAVPGVADVSAELSTMLEPVNPLAP